MLLRVIKSIDPLKHYCFAFIYFCGLCCALCKLRDKILINLYVVYVLSRKAPSMVIAKSIEHTKYYRERVATHMWSSLLVEVSYVTSLNTILFLNLLFMIEHNTTCECFEGWLLYRKYQLWLKQRT